MYGHSINGGPRLYLVPSYSVCVDATLPCTRRRGHTAVAVESAPPPVHRPHNAACRGQPGGSPEPRSPRAARLGIRRPHPHRTVARRRPLAASRLTPPPPAPWSRLWVHRGGTVRKGRQAASTVAREGVGRCWIGRAAWPARGRARASRAAAPSGEGCRKGGWGTATAGREVPPTCTNHGMRRVSWERVGILVKLGQIRSN